MEIPDEQAAEVDELLEVFPGRDRVPVHARVARGNAVDELALVQQVDRAQHLLIRARAAAAVRRRLVALERDGRNEVLHAQHLVGKGLVNERAVGEAEKFAVRVPLAERDDVLFAHKRFAARVDVKVYAHVLALTDDVVQLVEREVELVAVLCRPAARAVQVARRGRVHEDRPRDVALILRAQLILPLAANDVAVNEEVHERGLEHGGVNIVEDVLHHRVVRIGGVEARLADGTALALELSGAERVRPVEEFRQVLDRIFVEIVNGLLDAEFFDLV